MIKINHIVKYYGDFKSLDDICADVGEASVFGMVGSNGSGKSTLLRIMAGIFRPEAGSITYDGEKIYENAAKKQEVLYLSDDQYFLPYATINDMMRVFRAAYERFDTDRFEKLCRLFNLDPARRIRTFSKGMQKQTGLLLALAARPRYLLCDETFDGLDPVMRAIAKKLIAEAVSEDGMTAVIASHNLRELEDICDHICLLHKGSLLFESDIDSLKDNIHTVQVVLSPDFSAEKLVGIDIVSFRRRGSMATIVARGSEEELSDRFAALGAPFFEIVPMTLDEIFISEMEERGYDSSKIML